MSQKSADNHRLDRLSIGVVMLLIAGVAFGLWLVVSGDGPEGENRWLVVLEFVLGGLSLVGPPLLLWTAKRRPWGAGRFLWFAHGTAAWLLWPPVVYMRTRGVTANSTTAACFFYGTPLMAVHVTVTLLAGGHFKALAPAANPPLLAGNLRTPSGSRVGLHGALLDFAILSRGSPEIIPQ